ncbi:MAG: hypothetical protein HQM04_12815 [Magnetococcales bacterium]|nr:hypothetical protein [Magnetococcales bacterium]MBF0115908.1 hypothetical protein [Magnetococcales bacterium]
MKIFINPDAVANQEDWPYMIEIACRVFRGYHIFDHQSFTDIEGSEWYHHIEKFFGRLSIEKMIMSAAWPSSIHNKKITVTHQSNNIHSNLTPDHAVIFVSKPLKILIENRNSDGIFLKAMIRTLADKALIDYCNLPESITCDSPGGVGELPKTIEAFAAQSNLIPLRVIVMSDSDSEYIGDQKDHINKIKATCNKHNIPYHVLTKRSIENYIPDAIWIEWAKEPNMTKYKSKINDFLAHTTCERDYCNVKELFGDECYKLLDTYAQSLTRENLRDRDGHGELEKLLQMIMDET